MIKDIFFTTLKVIGAMLVLTFVLKWNVDTCLPPAGSEIFPAWLKSPQPVCETIKTWDINAHNYLAWKDSQVGMFANNKNEGVLFSFYFGLRTIIERLVYPTMVMASFPKDVGITLTYFTALFVLSFILAVFIELGVSILLGIKSMREPAAPAADGKKPRRRLTATMILLKPEGGGANSLVIRTGPRKSADDGSKN